MYSSGNAGRIYNPRPDPLEQGPPKRVLRDETHIGEMVAASKKRISWRFTLGESDTVHEVVLTHSIMSYKKLVEYDGRQMHFSSTATPGDWHYTMILDGLNYVMEVRINELESADVPKYDFVIDRVPFRRWDVYRRKKQPITTGTYAQPNAQPSNTYGQHRWGPNGAVPPEPAPSRGSFTGHPDRARSFSGSSGPRGRSSSGHQQWGANAAPYQHQQPSHYQERSSLPERPMPAVQSTHGGGSPPPAPAQRGSMRRQHQQQQHQQHQQPKAEINLIDDFGPSVSVSAQTLLFDPLAGTKMGVPAAGSGQPQQQPQVAPARVQPLSTPPVQAPYVDPFATVTPSAPLKPTSAPVNLDPFAAQRNQFVQQQPQQQPMMSGGAGYPMGYGQPQQAPMGGYAPQQQQQRASMTGGYAAPNGMGQANFNISQLMNPVALNSNVPTNQASKSINIDPFAGISR